MKTILQTSVKRLSKGMTVLAMLLVVQLASAQAVFDKFDNQDDIRAVIVNKKMFAMMAKMEVKDKDGQQFLALVKKLDN